jgi:hypothetical protein
VRARYPLLTIAVVSLAVLATAGSAMAASRGAPFGNDPTGFLRDRTPFAQDVREIARAGFARKLICAEDCLAGGRVLVSARQAEELGIAGQGDGEWVEIGRFANVRLEARTWKVVRVRLREAAERALRSADDSVRIYGESVGVSLQSWRHGQAGWARTSRKS